VNLYVDYVHNGITIKNHFIGKFDEEQDKQHALEFFKVNHNASNIRSYIVK